MLIPSVVAACFIALPAVAQSVMLKEIESSPKGLSRSVFLSTPDRIQPDGRSFVHAPLPMPSNAISTSDTFFHVSNRVVLKGTVLRVDAHAYFANEAYPNRFTTLVEPQLRVLVPVLQQPVNFLGKDLKVLFGTGIAF